MSERLVLTYPVGRDCRIAPCLSLSSWLLAAHSSFRDRQAFPSEGERPSLFDHNEQRGPFTPVFRGHQRVARPSSRTSCGPRCSHRRKTMSSKNIYVGNLPYQTT